MSLTQQQRQPAGRPVGGQFAATERADGDIVLDDQTGTNWPETASARQVARAREAADRQWRWSHEGEPTAADLEAIEADAMSRADVIAELEASFVAWESGMWHQDDNKYASIWFGETGGFSRAFVSNELGHLRQLQADLREGRVRPSKIVGSGYKPGAVRELAEKYLSDSIDTFELALSCGGKNLSVNQSNVRAWRRRDEAAARPF